MRLKTVSNRRQLYGTVGLQRSVTSRHDFHQQLNSEDAWEDDHNIAYWYILYTTGTDSSLLLLNSNIVTIKNKLKNNRSNTDDSQWRQSKFILRGWHFFPHREGARRSFGPKPDAHRAESRGGVGLGEIWCHLRPQNSLQNCLITCKLLQKG